MHTCICDLGTRQYQEVHRLQLECLDWRLAAKDRPELVLVVEHPSVFTLGKRGLRDSLLTDDAFLQARGIPVLHVERGGDITYHGPGQLVVYPIISLPNAHVSVKDYVGLLEELMIAVARAYGIMAHRDDRNRGVWVGNNKIGSIGISVRHGVTFHGMALNVTVDLAPFHWINPCGLTGVGATSLTREKGGPVDLEAVKRCLVKNMVEIFECTSESLSPMELQKKLHGKEQDRPNIDQ